MSKYKFTMKEDTPINDLPISKRVRNTLQRNGLMTFGDILSKKPVQFKYMYGFGPKQFYELDRFLKENGHTFGELAGGN